MGLEVVKIGGIVNLIKPAKAGFFVLKAARDRGSGRGEGLW